MKIEPFPGVLTAQKLERSYITKTGMKGHMRVKTWVLTDEQRDWLCRWYPEVENPLLIRASGMSHCTLHRFARELDLTKSERGMHGIKKRQIKAVKRTCERNGYYASKRGRQLSEAARKGVAKMWQDIRSGKREHPTRILARINPRKYLRWMKQRSEIRKETIRKEKQRVIYGLERKTRLNFVMCKYTKSQISHRYNALKRGYFVMEDCSEQSGERYNIYYDDNTQRSPTFEKNLEKDGFTLLKWKEE